VTTGAFIDLALASHPLRVGMTLQSRFRPRGSRMAKARARAHRRILLQAQALTDSLWETYVERMDHDTKTVTFGRRKLG
jgi:hypothetical protein